MAIRDTVSSRRMSGRVSLVTGSTQGIGRAIAERFIREGSDVWVHGLHRTECVRVADEIGASGWIAADLASFGEIEQAVERFHSSCTRLDVLVNNAGIENPEPLGDLRRETIERTFQINSIAPVMLVRGFIDLLTTQEGSTSVVNVTSIHQSVPYAGNVAYCMSKAALDMYTRTAALELAGYGIRVNSLAPGAIETEINRDVIEQMGRDKFKEWIPAGRVGTTNEITDPAVFLASDESAYVTGTTLYVDGGYSRNVLRYGLSNTQRQKGEDDHERS